MCLQITGSYLLKTLRIPPKKTVNTATQSEWESGLLYYICYLLLCSRSLQNLVPYKNRHLLSVSFCESEIWEQLSCGILALGLP